jgi:hypothetical protein
MDAPNYSRPSASPESEQEETFSPQVMPGQRVIQLRYWYESLPTPLQVVIAITALVLFLGLVNALLHFLASLLLFGIVLIIFLTLYRLAIAPPKKD